MPDSTGSVKSPTYSPGSSIVAKPVLSPPEVEEFWQIQPSDGDSIYWKVPHGLNPEAKKRLLEQFGVESDMRGTNERRAFALTMSRQDVVTILLYYNYCAAVEECSSEDMYALLFLRKLVEDMLAERESVMHGGKHVCAIRPQDTSNDSTILINGTIAELRHRNVPDEEPETFVQTCRDFEHATSTLSALSNIFPVGCGVKFVFTSRTRDNRGYPPELRGSRFCTVVTVTATDESGSKISDTFDASILRAHCARTFRNLATEVAQSAADDKVVTNATAYEAFLDNMLPHLCNRFQVVMVVPTSLRSKVPKHDAYEQHIAEGTQIRVKGIQWVHQLPGKTLFSSILVLRAIKYGLFSTYSLETSSPPEMHCLLNWHEFEKLVYHKSGVDCHENDDNSTTHVHIVGVDFVAIFEARVLLKSNAFAEAVRGGWLYRLSADTDRLSTKAIKSRTAFMHSLLTATQVHKIVSCEGLEGVRVHIENLKRERDGSKRKESRRPLLGSHYDHAFACFLSRSGLHVSPVSVKDYVKYHSGDSSGPWFSQALNAFGKAWNRIDDGAVQVQVEGDADRSRDPHDTDPPHLRPEESNVFLYVTPLSAATTDGSRASNAHIVYKYTYCVLRQEAVDRFEQFCGQVRKMWVSADDTPMKRVLIALDCWMLAANSNPASMKLLLVAMEPETKI